MASSSEGSSRRIEKYKIRVGFQSGNELNLVLAPGKWNTLRKAMAKAGPNSVWIEMPDGEGELINTAYVEFMEPEAVFEPLVKGAS